MGKLKAAELFMMRWTIEHNADKNLVWNLRITNGTHLFVHVGEHLTYADLRHPRDEACRVVDCRMAAMINDNVAPLIEHPACSEVIDSIHVIDHVHVRPIYAGTE